MTGLPPGVSDRVHAGYDRGAAELTVFTVAMAHELEANGHKGDPTTKHALVHVSELLYHTAKLYMAILYGQREAALEYSADCGNHAWMAAASAGVLDVALLTDGLEGKASDGLYDGDKDADAAQSALLARATANLADGLAHGQAAWDIEAEVARLVGEAPWTFKREHDGFYEPLKELSREFSRMLAELVKNEETARGRRPPSPQHALDANRDRVGDGDPVAF